MDKQCKYVMLSFGEGKGEVAIIFPPDISHVDAIPRRTGERQIVSAGFVQMWEGDISCNGMSETLTTRLGRVISARPQDAKIIKHQLEGR